MNTKSSPELLPANLEFDDRQPPEEDILREVLEGLRRSPKSLSPKLFYDEKGSDLFLRITELPEYYPTRTEKALLPKVAADLKGALGAGCHVVEYGCGNSGKVNLLLQGLGSAASYVAIDISREHLLQCCRDLASAHPMTLVRAVCADFTQPLSLDGILPRDGGRRLAFFPGSSIGNFEPEHAVRFLENIRAALGASGSLLIGVDVRKSPQLLNAAYNDGEGVTALFNLNLLRRINRDAGADFSTGDFVHRAFYDDVKGRIEMHLESRKAQTVTVGGIPIGFEAGETIHTENSYKYHAHEFADLAASAGWRAEGLWQDKDRFFSIHYLVNRNGREERAASNLRSSSRRFPALTLIKA